MINDEIYKLLSENCILGHALPQNIERYLTDSCICICSFSSGEEIFSPKQKVRRVGIMLSGTAQVLPASGAENAMLKLLCSGDMFGISNLYSQKLPFPSIITAKCACAVLFIDAEAFMKLIENDQAALKAYLTLLNNKIGYLNQKISTLTAGSTEKKLALFIAENQCDGVLSPSFSMSALADMLNIGRASLYRALDSLLEQGLIARDGKKIIILDKNALLNLS